jgi:hypothetical protein
MKRPEPAEPENREIREADTLVGYRIAVFPEEDEAANAPEKIHPEQAILVKDV